jgi:hypothetical protein
MAERARPSPNFQPIEPLMIGGSGYERNHDRPPKRLTSTAINRLRKRSKQLAARSSRLYDWGYIP